jgi:hypothetical protein
LNKGALRTYSTAFNPRPLGPSSGRSDFTARATKLGFESASSELHAACY